MGGISLDAFRTMASGAGGCTSVAVETDAQTRELSLVGRKVEATKEVNVRTREMLVSLMAADLRRSFGVEDVDVDAFVNELRRDFAGEHAGKVLTRKDDLSKAFNLFDTFKIKKLTERKFSQGVASAEKASIYKSLAFENQFADGVRVAGRNFKAPLDPFENDKNAKEKELKAYEQEVGRPIEKAYDTAAKKLNDFVTYKLRPLASSLSSEALANVLRVELAGKGDLEGAKAEADALEKALERHGIAVDAAKQKSGVSGAKVGLSQILRQLKTLEDNLEKATTNFEFWEYIRDSDVAATPEALTEKGWGTPRFLEIAQKWGELKASVREAKAKHDALTSIQAKIQSGKTFEVPEEFRGDERLQSAIREMQAAYGGVKDATDRNADWKKLQADISQDKSVDKEVGKGAWKNAVADELKSLKDAVVVARKKQEDAAQYYDSNLEKFKERMSVVDDAFNRLGDDLHQSKSYGSRLKALCKQAGVKISERTFTRFYNERGDAVKQAALALIGGSEGKLQPQQAILQAVRTLRDIEINAGKTKVSTLNATDRQLVDFLLNHSGSSESVKGFLRNNAALRMGISYQLMGGLKLLANLPNTDRSVTLAIPVAANGKKQERLTLLQSADNSLKFIYKGHTYEMAVSAKDLYTAILSTRIVDEFDPATYDSVSSDTDPAVRSEHENWPGSVDQDLVVAHIDEMLRALRECNNKDVDTYGAAPHFNSRMPCLDSAGGRTKKIFGIFDTGRTETFLRKYFSQQIAQCKNPISRWWERRKAAFMGVQLEGSASVQSGENTLFENAALFLHQLRLLAKNANYIISRFDKSSGANVNKSENKVAEDGCYEFNRITQFTLHPKYDGERFTCDQHLRGITSALTLYYRSFKKAEEAGQLERFFTTITEGACFNGCSRNLEDLASSYGALDLDYESMPEFSAGLPRNQGNPVAAPAGRPASAQTSSASLQSPAGKWLDEIRRKAEESKSRQAQSAADSTRMQSRYQFPEGVLDKQPAEAPDRVVGDQPVAEQPKIQKILPSRAAKRPAAPVSTANLFDYVKSELRALDNTVNPPGTKNPKTFTWSEVVPFLRARRREFVKEKFDVLWNWWRQEGPRQLADFKNQKTEETREQWRRSLESGVRRNSLTALLVDKYVDLEKGELRVDLMKADYAAYERMFEDGLPEEPAAAGARRTLEDVVIGSVRNEIRKTELAYVDDDGQGKSLNLADPGFLGTVEKTLKTCGLIRDDGSLLPFSCAGDAAKTWSLPPPPPAPDAASLVREFEAKKADGKLAIHPDAAKALHGGKQNLSAYLQEEIRLLYETVNPPGTEKPRVIAWGEFQEFMKERLDKANAAQMEKAARIKYKDLADLEVRSATLHKRMSDANAALILMSRCGEEEKKQLIRLLSLEDDTARQTELKKLPKDGSLRKLALRFVNSDGKPIDGKPFSLEGNVKDWLSRFRASDAPTCRRMLDDLVKSGDLLLSHLEEFVDTKNASLKKNVFSEDGAVEFTPEELKRLSGEAEQAFLNSKLEQFVESQRRMLRESGAELSRLAQPDYPKDEVEKARQDARLKLFCNLDSLIDFQKTNGDSELNYEAREFFPGYQMPYVEYSSAGFWKLVEHVLVADGIIKNDDTREYIRGGRDAAMTYPHMWNGQLSKSSDFVQRITPDGKNVGEKTRYDPTVHGTEFIKALGRDGSTVWRSPDGQYEIRGKEETSIKGIANLDGDAELKKGDLRVPARDVET